MILSLAGGVGAAKLLAGLVTVVDPTDLTVIGNTADDIVLHGLHISPDLDTITYTLAGEINPETGWGLRSESWTVMANLEQRYQGQAWFRLGDRDLATHLYRTQRLSDGATLSAVTAEITEAWGLGLRLIPVTDDHLATMVTVEGEGEISFQDYFVGRRHSVPVTSIRFDGSETAEPAPGVLAAIESAERIVVCPSNPIVSIGPLLSVKGVREALTERREDVIAISPIVNGLAIKGPAARMLTELGHDSSVTGVAQIYAPWASKLVIDEADADLARAVADSGMNPLIAPTVMSDVEAAAALSRMVLSA